MSSHTDEAMAQITRLREQVETLMREKVAPAASDLSDRAGAASRDAVDTLGQSVRAQPIPALLIAAGIGYLFGRLSR